tara:strand:+ start:145 stop:981 length:837 start_codon:yes stop_codon:yes gene_type:complete
MLSENNPPIKSNPTHSVIVDLHTLHKESASLIGSAIVFSVILIICWFAALFTWPIKVLDATPENGFFVLAFTMMLAVGVTIFIISIILGIKFLKKRREIQLNVIQSQSVLVKRSYLMNFELEEPIGTSQKDKIFNHLCLVFPQVNEIKNKRLKKGHSSIDSISGTFLNKLRRKVHIFRKYDLSLDTSTGYFVIKITNDKTVTFSDIEDELKSIQKQLMIEKLGMGYKDVISRFIFLAKSYDDTFSNDTLNEKMKSLKRYFLVDIIKEEDYGYSTIWID